MRFDRGLRFLQRFRKAIESARSLIPDEINRGNACANQNEIQQKATYNPRNPPPLKRTDNRIQNVKKKERQDKRHENGLRIAQKENRADKAKKHKTDSLDFQSHGDEACTFITADLGSGFSRTGIASS